MNAAFSRAACIAIATLFVCAHGVHAQSIELKAPPTSAMALGGRAVGFIRHISTDPTGRALVLGGASRQEIFVIDADGKVSARSAVLPEIGARLGWPAAAAFDGPNSAVIIDSQSPLWARLELIRGQWVVDTVSSTKFSRVSSVCTINGKRYVMAKAGESTSSALIHEVSAAGAVNRSFGTPFVEVENPAVGYGHLLCLTTPAVVVAASKLHPEIRAYSPVGKLLWATQLPSFQPMGFRVDGRRVLFEYAADSLWDQTVSVFAPTPDIVAVQVGRSRGRNGLASYLQVRTLYLSTATGDVLGSQLGLPVIMTATARQLYVVSEKNAQELEIYSYHLRQR